MEESLAAHTLTRSALLRPYYMALYAGALIRGDRCPEAQDALNEAMSVAEHTTQLAYASETHRLQAQLQELRGEHRAAETSYLRSLSTAIDQGSRWLELRAARAFANYLAANGRPGEARDMLAPVVGAITEGKDTLDYVYADALLRTL